MKKYIFAINLLAILLLISSCEDIVDADYKIKKTKINYNTVIADQENGVIMPLKIGNVWVYKITSYSLDGKVDNIYFDTLIVKKEVIVNGDKWYVVNDIGEDYDNPDLVTNTDVGLFFKDSEDPNQSVILAEYPLIHSTYYNGNQIQSTLYHDPTQIYDDTLDYWTDANIITGYPTVYGKYNAYKYLIWGQFRKQNLILKPYEIEYFVPDIGMIRSEGYYLNDDNTMTLSSVAELIYTNLIASKPLQQNTYKIDFKQIHAGQSKDSTFINIIDNDTQSNLVINSIQIVQNTSFAIVNPPALPLTITPNNQFGLMMNFTPVSLGDFESFMQIYTNQGMFTVKLLGRCIN